MLGAHQLGYSLGLCLATVCTGVLLGSLCLVCWLFYHYSGIPCMICTYKLSYSLGLCLTAVLTCIFLCTCACIRRCCYYYSGIPYMLGAHQLGYSLGLCLATVCTGVLLGSLVFIRWCCYYYSGIPIMTDTNIQCVLFIVFIILFRIARILCLFQIWCICNEIHNLAILLSKCIQITSRCTVILCPYV